MPYNFTPCTDDELALYRRNFAALLRGGKKDLSTAEHAAAVPRRGPAGCPQNRDRGAIVRSLNAAGFTYRWESLR